MIQLNQTMRKSLPESKVPFLFHASFRGCFSIKMPGTQVYGGGAVVQ